MVSIFFKPFLKIREHLIKRWHFSFLPLLVLVIHFTWEVGCVFLIPSNSAARRLALRAHSRHHGNQRIAVMRSRAFCVTTQCYCSPRAIWERHVNIPTKEDWLLFRWSSCAACMDCCLTLECASLPCSDFRNGWFAPWSLCSAPSRPCYSETLQRNWTEPAIQKHQYDHTRWGQRPP